MGEPMNEYRWTNQVQLSRLEGRQDRRQDIRDTLLGHRTGASLGVAYSVSFMQRE
jgi:hypothetical protein